MTLEKFKQEVTKYNDFVSTNTRKIKELSKYKEQENKAWSKMPEELIKDYIDFFKHLFILIDNMIIVREKLKLKSDFLKQSKNFFDKRQDDITINFKKLLNYNYSRTSSFKRTYRNNIKTIFENFEKTYKELNIYELNNIIKQFKST